MTENKKSSPIMGHNFWKARVNQESVGKKQSLHQGLSLGYINSVTIDDIFDQKRNNGHAESL